MRFLFLLGVEPRASAKQTQSQRATVKGLITDWFDDLRAKGVLVEQLSFDTWKEARTVTLADGKATDQPGPLTVGPYGTQDSVLIACAVVDVRSSKEAVALAKTWPVPHAVVEVRPLKET